ncbi:hypothetical protein V491_05041 [Pseudogymnoascus sp. VKM F-3775]|nr:hypothetical protein V491_05041 [Pseudogymnoascus sp. VKM F-3775]
MRFSTILLSSVVAVLSVHAQANNGTATTVSPAVSGTSKPTAGQQAATICLESCPDNDNDCRAKCQLLANSVNPIADCQSACTKGDGSATANQNYQTCFENCKTISTSAAAEETGTATGTATGTGSGAASTSGSTSGDATESGSDSDVKASGTEASPSATATGAAANMAVGVSVGAGLGLVAMMLAL